ncbi:MAG: HDOD domain-containing protein [Gammaproteobacteria bacterium]|nr:HDOD domain-containing protein [Gammaproteobacteria bacterium]
MLPIAIQRFLDTQNAAVQLLHHPPTETLTQAARVCGIRESQLMRALVLIDAQGPLMAILPSNHLLDFDALCTLLGRELEPVPASQLHGIFDDCEAHCCPPVGAAYGLDVIIDAVLLEEDTLYLEPGSHSLLLCISRDEFTRLQRNPRIGHFSHPVSALQRDNSAASLSKTIEQFTPARIKRRVEEFHELPALPGTALAILDLASNPRANAADLGKVIEQDAPLAARILRYANSSLYGYPGKIKDLKSAIARVLGFDFVLNLALGITVGKSLRVPADGPLGLDAFWRHSVHSAALVERLSQMMPADKRPRRGTAYLAGLLHNMGMLLLGHAFQAEFFLLNRYLDANPGVPVETIEKYVLGVGHDQIGAWLLAAWGLPEELVTAARHHHDENYWGDHAAYSQLVLIADRLLARCGLGTTTVTELPTTSLEKLGLDAAKVIAASEALWAGNIELDELARMVA